MTTKLVSSGLVPEYPKIETLYNRDPANMKRVVVGEYRSPEFLAVNRWLVTEKVDGTNVRIAVFPDGRVFYGGRTDDSQMPPHLLQYLTERFPLEVLRCGVNESPEVVTIYGEGYGHKIQNGGNYRSDGVSLRVFDVRVGDIWLAQNAVRDIAKAITAATVPDLGVMTTEEAIACVGMVSRVSQAEGGKCGFLAEGVVARSDPLMLDRMGNRIMWKLKARDLA